MQDRQQPQALNFEYKEGNDTAKLKGLLERVTSLSVVETDILEAMVELSRGLKQDE